MKKQLFIFLSSILLLFFSGCYSDEEIEEIRSEAFTEGYEEGYFVGLDEGEDAGYEDGYAAGEIRGYNIGYDEGYDAGYDEGYVSSVIAVDTGTYATPAPTQPAQSYTVYVSKSGKKIHRSSTCSGMRNYWTMTYDEAVAQGYDHCNTCY